jgi:hypothetical protein
MPDFLLWQTRHIIKIDEMLFGQGRGSPPDNPQDDRHGGNQSHTGYGEPAMGFKAGSSKGGGQGVN